MMQEEALYRELLATEGQAPHANARALRPVTDYARLVRHESWQQVWDAEARTTGPVHQVSGYIWSDAIESCLREHSAAFIPQSAIPIYIDRPIVLHSGDRLIVHPQTEIRLKSGPVSTCMVRNANIVFSQDRPVNMCAGSDATILIEGGIWSDQYNEGRGRGGVYDQGNTMRGAQAAFLLHNIKGVTVRNVLFRDCSAFGIQIGNVTDFVLENLAFDETADGVHIEGPAARGIIRRITGKTNDDIIALNAWDWDFSSLTFGPITDMLVEDIESPPGYTWSELRLLPGTKVFASGETVDCDIRRCVFRNIRGIHTFKMYDQPNLGKPELDFADPIGKMSDLFFSDVVADGIRRSDYYDKSSDALWDICADVEGLSIRNVRLSYTPGEGEMPPYLVSVGPKSLTWLKGQTAEEGWKEIFNPNANPVVSGLTVKGVYLPDPRNLGCCVPCADIARLIHARELSLNPDFPRTLPRGGTGKGRIVDLHLD
jgi:hypothetical protein